MQTVIRDKEGKIQFVRGDGNYFLSLKDRDILLETKITTEMITNTFKDDLNMFASILNGESNLELIKIRILNENGYTIIVKQTFI